MGINPWGPEPGSVIPGLYGGSVYYGPTGPTGPTGPGNYSRDWERARLEQQLSHFGRRIVDYSYNIETMQYHVRYNDGSVAVLAELPREALTPSLYNNLMLQERLRLQQQYGWQALANAAQEACARPQRSEKERLIERRDLRLRRKMEYIQNKLALRRKRKVLDTLYRVAWVWGTLVGITLTIKLGELLLFSVVGG